MSPQQNVNKSLKFYEFIIAIDPKVPKPCLLHCWFIHSILRHLDVCLGETAAEAMVNDCHHPPHYPSSVLLSILTQESYCIVYYSPWVKKGAWVDTVLSIISLPRPLRLVVSLQPTKERYSTEIITAFESSLPHAKILSHFHLGHRSSWAAEVLG